MFNTTLLYEIVKKGTPYDVIIGGGDLPANFDNGSVIITLLNSQTITQSHKDFETIKQEDSTIQAYSVIQNNYQFDLYRANPKNHLYLDVEIEAQKLREYLKSYDVQEYLKAKEAEVLPTISQINFLNDFNEQKKLINRAFFEVSVCFKVYFTQEINIFDKIQITNNILGGN